MKTITLTLILLNLNVLFSVSSFASQQLAPHSRYQILSHKDSFQFFSIVIDGILNLRFQDKSSKLNSMEQILSYIPRFNLNNPIEKSVIDFRKKLLIHAFSVLGDIDAPRPGKPNLPLNKEAKQSVLKKLSHDKSLVEESYHFLHSRCSKSTLLANDDYKEVQLAHGDLLSQIIIHGTLASANDYSRSTFTHLDFTKDLKRLEEQAKKENPTLLPILYCFASFIKADDHFKHHAKQQLMKFNSSITQTSLLKILIKGSFLLTNNRDLRKRAIKELKDLDKNIKDEAVFKAVINACLSLKKPIHEKSLWSQFIKKFNTFNHVMFLEKTKLILNNLKIAWNQSKLVKMLKFYLISMQKMQDNKTHQEYANIALNILDKHLIKQKTREKIFSYLSVGGKINFICMLGGTNSHVGILTDQGLAGKMISNRWETENTPQETREKILNNYIETIFNCLKTYDISPDDIGEIGFSWAGPGDYDEGRVISTNVNGLKKEDLISLNPELIEKGGYPFSIDIMDRLAQKIHKKIPVKILHDATAGAKGEHFLNTGKMLEHTYAAGKVKKLVNEIGHQSFGRLISPKDKIKDDIDYQYIYVPDENGSFPQLDAELGELDAEDLLAGPAVARRFIEDMDQSEIQSFFSNKFWSQTDEELKEENNNGEISIRKKFNIESQEQALSLLNSKDLAQDLIRKKLRDQILIYIHHQIDYWMHEKEPNPKILKFATKIEMEIGFFLNNILSAYPKGYSISVIIGTGIGAGFLKLENKEQPTEIHLISGFSEKFHRAASSKEGWWDEIGRLKEQYDPFIKNIRQAAGSSLIFRSKNGGEERESAAFYPKKIIRANNIKSNETPAYYVPSFKKPQTRLKKWISLAA